MFTVIYKYLTAGLVVSILATSGWALVERYKLNKIRLDLATTKAEVTTQTTRANNLENALSEMKRILKAAEDSVAERDQALAELNQKKEESDAKLRTALRENRDWSDTPVPDSVRDAITNRD